MVLPKRVCNVWVYGSHYFKQRSASVFFSGSILMKVEGYSTRSRERINLKIPLRVTGKESRNQSWTESSVIQEATSCGVGFTLCRPVEPGRLLHLSCPMPRQLRAFNYFKPEYQVWGLVRYILSKTSGEKNPQIFFLGVALVGQHPPVSYEQNPATLYDITPIRSTNGLWVLREKPRFIKHYTRRTERTKVSKEAAIEVLDEHGMITQTGFGTIVDISIKGAAIHTELQIPHGSFLRIVDLDNNSTMLSLVRLCRPVQDGLNRLNVEFIDRVWQD